MQQESSQIHVWTSFDSKDSLIFTYKRESDTQREHIHIDTSQFRVEIYRITLQ